MKRVIRVRKDEEIKARVDGRTKAEVAQLAFTRGLDMSDLLREAIRELLTRNRRDVFVATR